MKIKNSHIPHSMMKVCAFPAMCSSHVEKSIGDTHKLNWGLHKDDIKCMSIKNI